MRPEFEPAAGGQFRELVELNRGLLTRTISEVHLHHTFLPTRAFYTDLAGPGDRDGKASGREINARLWTSHVERLGWDDIAQHVTIDPAGRIWPGRDWNLPPASATGHNGNATLGPFMVALVGNFEAGAETPSPAQLDAAATVIAEVQRAFGLAPEALRLHRELDARCTCPGAIDRAVLVAEVRKRHATPSVDREAGPLGRNQREVYRLLRRGERGTGRGSLGDQPPACSGWDTAWSLGAVSATGRGVNLRGGAAAGEAVTPEMFRLLRSHVIHLRSGRFVTEGAFATTASDVHDIVRRLTAWAASPAAGATPRAMIWAHGGLNALEPALHYAWSTHRWWLASGIYPIYFVWETGAIETALQIVEEQLGTRGRALGDIDDWIVESLVHAIGRPFWEQMKVSAENAAMKGDDRGAYVLARALGKLHATKAGPKPEIHVVGHSAGAIFHGHFVKAARAAEVPVETLTFLAPACTVAFFDAMVRPELPGIGRYRQFILDRARELADTTVPVYDKSLLYLVSRGFEARRGAPILGLEESIRQDDGLIDLFGLGGAAPEATLVIAPTRVGTAPGRASGAITHGGFDNDPKTLEAIRADIFGDALPADAPPAPEPPTARGTERLYRTLRETYPYAYGALPAAPALVAAAPVLAAPAIAAPRLGGARQALSIGIDAYGGGNALAGCVADSGLWSGLFADLGFEVTTLRDHDATRDGILAAVEGLARSGRAGDLLALHYSGHGIRLPDDGGDESDGDGKDEAIVPVDGPETGEYVLDDDMRRLLGLVHPEAHLTFFADCCHSGTSTRFTFGAAAPTGLRQRYIEPTRAMLDVYENKLRARPAGRSVARAEPEGGEEAMSHLLFAACRDRQTAKESEGNGWFSRVATRLLREARAPLTNQDFRRRIEEEFARLGYSDADQSPQLEGRVAAKGGLVLGGVLVGNGRA